MVSPPWSSSRRICLFVFLTISYFITFTFAQDVLCSKDKKCPNKACCYIADKEVDDGICGYGAEFCSEGCVSNCDAHAECGKDAEDPGKKCPLNVCCSKWGFCGTSEDFCDTGKGCQNNCFTPSKPSCGDRNVFGLKIGYYESWSTLRNCGGMPPESLPAEQFTHLYYSFATFREQGGKYYIVLDPKIGGDYDLLIRFTNLKRDYPGLKCYIAIGGWTFNDEPTQKAFTNMASKDESRRKFAEAIFNFVRDYAFDGVDLDWEYPGAEDRGGVKEDTENYVKLIKAIREEFDNRGGGYGISFTIPASFWYLRWFDVSGMLDAGADWANIMSYDMHGTWDSDENFVGKVLGAHTDSVEIQGALNLLWRDTKLDPKKIVMGFGFYGRSFKMANPSCNIPGCRHADGGASGACTDTSGVLSWAEISELLKAGAATTEVYDEKKAVKYMTYDEDSWVSYDDDQTFKQKLQQARDNCLGGIMIWAVDLDTPDFTALSNLLGTDVAGHFGDDDDLTIDELKGATGEDCYVTETCGNQKTPPKCKSGYRVLDYIHEPLNGQIPLQRPCSTNTFRSICCPMRTMPRGCSWTGCDSNQDTACPRGKFLMATEGYKNREGTEVCKPMTGRRRLCCDSRPAFDVCGWGQCTKSDRCSGPDSDREVVLSSVLAYDDSMCPTGEKSHYCCEKDKKPKNCKWIGPDNGCTEFKCPSGKVQWTKKEYVDGEKSGTTISCTNGRQMSYCCDPPKDEDSRLSVDPADIFPKPLGDNEEEYTMTPDSNTQSEGSTRSSILAGSGGGADEAFSFVLVDGTEGAVDNNFAEAWNILDQETPNFQLKKREWTEYRKPGEVRHDTFENVIETYRVVCAAGMSAAECKRIFIMNAEDTIIKLPNGIGSGPYARIVSFKHIPDAKINYGDRKRLNKRRTQLRKRNLAIRDLEEEHQVFELVTDFDFAAINAAAKPGAEVQYRTDWSNLLDYWDDVTDEDPDGSGMGTNKKRGLEKRWFGSFKNWLKKVTTIKKEDKGTLEMEYEKRFTIFHFEDRCQKGNTLYQAEIDASAYLHMAMSATYSYLFQGQILPVPKTESAYAYFGAEPFVHVLLTLQGSGSIQSTSGNYKIVNGVTWPGLSIKGLIRIGPELNVNARIDTSLSISGKAVAGFAVGFNAFEIAFPQNSDGKGGSRNPTKLNKDNHQIFSVDQTLKAEVKAEGHISLTVTPSLSFGIEALGGKLMKGDVILGVDNTIDLGVSAAGSADAVSGGAGAAFCIWADYIYRVFVEAEVSVLSGTFDWGGSIDLATPSSPIGLLPKKCLTYGSQQDKRDLEIPKALLPRNDRTGTSGETRPVFGGLFECPNGENDDEPSNACDDGLKRRDLDSAIGFIDGFSPSESAVFERSLQPRQSDILCYNRPTQFYNCNMFGSYNFNPTNKHTKAGGYTVIGICENIKNGIRSKSAGNPTRFRTGSNTAVLTYSGSTGNRGDACGDNAPVPNRKTCSTYNSDKWDGDKFDTAKNEATWTSCDEFPYNSAREGGVGATTACVSVGQQNMQGTLNTIVSNMKYKNERWANLARNSKFDNIQYNVVLSYPPGSTGWIGEIESWRMKTAVIVTTGVDWGRIVGGMNNWGNPNQTFGNTNGVCLDYLDTPGAIKTSRKNQNVYQIPFHGCYINFNNDPDPDVPDVDKRSAYRPFKRDDPTTWGAERVIHYYDSRFTKEMLFESFGPHAHYDMRPANLSKRALDEHDEFQERLIKRLMNLKLPVGFGTNP
ncbi:hypothetical protein TWF106_000530 [Orbilia oligospora]|uniref:chitinase n=1 Tax=Orbilia oligospora TaxID=2813651 RepID=A0A7C8UA58_ORBOL|nr:hypothetical protein TWF788_009528 [Orbilia oligospora]KAF3206923.1 hypothetical protein TWF106_000530 [Orbilia oligospora]KAF3210310.1 hypothetical protein TWF679_006805 [Orbilia oligospora]